MKDNSLLRTFGNADLSKNSQAVKQGGFVENVQSEKS